MTSDRSTARTSPEGRPEAWSPDVGDASTRRALESLLRGLDAEAGSDPGLTEDEAGRPSIDAADVPDPDAPVQRAAEPGDWEVLLRAEEARWQRYGRPCMAVELEVVGGSDLESHLGDEAGARVRGIVADLLAETTRASDHYEARSGWRFVALLPETDEAGAAVAFDRLQRAFATAMGPALALRLAVGAAAPAPSGTMRVAYHQAARELAIDRRRDRMGDIATAAGGDPAPAAPGAAAATSLAADAADQMTRPEPSVDAAGLTEHLDTPSRLEALVHLLGDGYISQAEYDLKRSEILDRL